MDGTYQLKLVKAVEVTLSVGRSMIVIHVKTLISLMIDFFFNCDIKCQSELLRGIFLSLELDRNFSSHCVFILIYLFRLSIETEKRKVADEDDR